MNLPDTKALLRYHKAKLQYSEAEREMAAARREIVKDMPEEIRAACLAAAAWLHLRDGDRGAASACTNVLRALAPWYEDVEGYEEVFRIFDGDEDDSVLDQRKGETE